jgi:hypothetical protein
MDKSDDNVLRDHKELHDSDTVHTDVCFVLKNLGEMENDV